MAAPHGLTPAVQSDPKQGEREYFARIGPEGVAHSLAKPFADDSTAQYLAAMTALFGLMAPPPRRIIEFGCGTGWLSLALAQRGYDVVGVDISADAIRHAEAARVERRQERARFVAADYETFATTAPFDYAVFHDSLHHAEDARAALLCAWRALGPAGLAITIEPGTGHHKTPHSQRAIREFGVHEQDMPPHRIMRLAREVGFRRCLPLPHPHDLNRAFYRRKISQEQTAFDLCLLRMISIGRAIGRMWDTRHHGLVVLWK